MVWAIIIMALIGNIIAMAGGHSAAVVNYCLFVAAFTMLTWFYLIAATFSEKAAIHPVIVFIVDALNMVLVFCAAVALPSKLHAPNCGSDVGPPSLPPSLSFLLSFFAICMSPPFHVARATWLTGVIALLGRNRAQPGRKDLQLARKELPRCPGGHGLPVVPVVHVLDLHDPFGDPGDTRLQGALGPREACPPALAWTCAAAVDEPGLILAAAFNLFISVCQCCC